MDFRQLQSQPLKLNHQKLNRNYLETIAGQWKRLNIETVEEAMKLTEKEYKKMKKIAAKNETKPKTKQEKKEILPDWFDQEQQSEQVTKEEEEEWNKILSSLV